MDPDSNLREQRKLAESIMKSFDSDEGVDAHDAARLAELVDALDQWLVRGGFLPSRWQVAQASKHD